MLPGDVAVARFVQGAPQPPARWLADFGNWIGSARFCFVVSLGIVIVLIVRRCPWELWIVVLALLARALNGALKALFDSPRPTPDLVRVTEHADGLGFPSGHAMGSLLCYGAITVVAFRIQPWRPVRHWVAGVCAVIILLVGFGRIYVGAHWPSDVLGGYLWGSLLLMGVVLLVAAVQKPVECRAAKRLIRRDRILPDRI